MLQAGDQQLDLGDILDTAPALGQMRQTAAPEAIEATVVEVIDGETIAIEKDGVRQTVRYLGVDVPTGDACYAAESTDANRALVEGKTVRIERQATDVDASNWSHVWVGRRTALRARRIARARRATADITTEHPSPPAARGRPAGTPRPWPLEARQGRRRHAPVEHRPSLADRPERPPPYTRTMNTLPAASAIRRDIQRKQTHARHRHLHGPPTRPGLKYATR